MSESSSHPDKRHILAAEIAAAPTLLCWKLGGVNRFFTEFERLMVVEALRAFTPSHALQNPTAAALIAEIEEELNKPKYGAESVWYCVADDKPCPKDEGCSAGHCDKYGQPAVEKVRRLARLANRAAEALKTFSPSTTPQKPGDEEYIADLEFSLRQCADLLRAVHWNVVADFGTSGDGLQKAEKVLRDVEYFVNHGIDAARSAIATITHVICFEGEGAEVIVCTSWKDCTDKFFSALVGGDPAGVPLDERTSWLDAFADDDNWNHDEDRRRHCFMSDIGEISKVRIYQLNNRSDGGKEAKGPK